MLNKEKKGGGTLNMGIIARGFVKYSWLLKGQCHEIFDIKV